MMGGLLTLDAKSFREGEPGFTLLEVLVALVIAGLASAAIGNAIAASLSRSDQQSVLAALDRMIGQARTEALRRQEPISLRLADESRTLSIPELAASYEVPRDVAVTFTGIGSLGLASDTVVYFLADGSTTGARVAVQADGATVYRQIGWVSGRIDQRVPHD